MVTQALKLFVLGWLLTGTSARAGTPIYRGYYFPPGYGGFNFPAVRPSLDPPNQFFKAIDRSQKRYEKETAPPPYRGIREYSPYGG